MYHELRKRGTSRRITRSWSPGKQRSAIPRRRRDREISTASSRRTAPSNRQSMTARAAPRRIIRPARRYPRGSTLP